MEHETGHIINVAHFEILISRATGFSTAYNPSNPLIKLIGLNSTLTNSQNSLLKVDNKLIADKNNIDARDIIFSPVSKLTTRIYNALASCGTTPQIIADAKTFTRKLQGKRAVPIKPITPTPTIEATITPTPVPTPPLPEPVHHSASQMSFDNRIENFQKLILLLISEPLYNPNEADLTITALNTYLASMRAANSAVISSTTDLKNARISRNKILYAPITGLFNLQIEVKNYVKSIFGASSDEFKEVSKIKFRDNK